MKLRNLLEVIAGIAIITLLRAPLLLIGALAVFGYVVFFAVRAIIRKIRARRAGLEGEPWDWELLGPIIGGVILLLLGELICYLRDHFM